jgi:DNA-binding beta-propeller fold protein YncE
MWINFRPLPRVAVRSRYFKGGIAAVIAALAVIALPFGARSSELPLRQVGADVPLPGKANRFDYASVDPQRRLLFLAHLGSGMVTAVDLRTNRIIANVSDVPSVHGVLAVPELGEVFASTTGQNRLDVISEETYRVIARAPAGTYPDGMAYAPDSRELFISDESGRTETVIDTRTNRRVATIPLGGEAGNPQYDPISHEVFVDVQTLDEIAAIDPRTNKLVAHYSLPHSCRDDHSLLIDAPAHLAFVACDDNAKLLLVDMTDMHVLSVNDVGRDPDVLAFDPGLGRLYVASESGVVAVFELKGKDLQLLGRKFLAYEAHSVAVDPATHLVYFPLQSIHGRGVLRVMAPTDVSRRTPP